MFNNLPNNLKKEVKKQYYLRLAIVASILFVLIEIVAMVAVFPSWNLSQIKKQELQDSLTALVQSSDTVRATPDSVSIETTNEILRVLSTSHAYPDVLPLLNTILSFERLGVTFDKFSYSSKSATEAIISIEGLAKTREVLVAFVKDLKNSGSFVSVDLPVSNLAKNSNIDFVINIAVEQKK